MNLLQVERGFFLCLSSFIQYFCEICVAYSYSLFIIVAISYSNIWIYQIYLMSIVDEHLAFPSLGLLIKVLLHSFRCWWTFPLGDMCLGVKLVGPRFWALYIVQQFSKVVIHFTNPIIYSSFSVFSPTLDINSLFHFCHSGEYTVLSHCILLVIY